MKNTLTQALNFSLHKDHQTAIKIAKWCDVNYYETLALYCSDNGIDMLQFKDSDIDSAVDTMAQHGQNDAENDHYYFWIDLALDQAQLNEALQQSDIDALSEQLHADCMGIFRWFCGYFERQAEKADCVTDSRRIGFLIEYLEKATEDCKALRISLIKAGR